MALHQLARVSARPVGCSFVHVTQTSVMQMQKREVHESYLPAGRGGRSSFSGMVATVFGGTGFIGHIFLNRLSRLGTSIMLPYRGSYQHIARLKIMSDLGQMLFREFTIKQDDDKVRELIRYSNCVVNLIGSKKPFHHYSMEEVNQEWPARLATLVAEKNDGTRLLHMTHLNCHQEEGRKISNILEMDYQTEKRMRDIYPDTIIVRAAGVCGFLDYYSNFFVNDRFEDLAKFGALPLLYDNGMSTTVQPVCVGDVAEALTRILKHLDSPGKTFELVGPDRFLLKDFVEYIYKVTRKDCFMYDTLGPMDKSKANILQKGIQKGLDYYFDRTRRPRFILPRFIDMLSRQFTSHEQWTTKDYFNQIHLTDHTTGCPGFEQLGITPTHFEEKAYSIHGWMHGYEQYTIPTKENFPLTKQSPIDAPRISA